MAFRSRSIVKPLIRGADWPGRFVTGKNAASVYRPWKRRVPNDRVIERMKFLAATHSAIGNPRRRNARNRAIPSDRVISRLHGKAALVISKAFHPPCPLTFRCYKTAAFHYRGSKSFMDLVSVVDTRATLFTKCFRRILGFFVFLFFCIDGIKWKNFCKVL